MERSARGNAQRDLFSTLTHARLRAAQGDVEGARAMLGGILRADPTRGDARELLAELDRVLPKAGEGDPAGRQREEPRRAAATADLAARFRKVVAAPSVESRADRLRRVLERYRRARGTPGGGGDV